MAESEPTTNSQSVPRTTVGGHIDFSATLETFQGPLDLLLYLLKENEVEITDIPIAVILEQYLRFMDQAGQWDLQLAGEFLVMAATLMEIKSRELLPVEVQPGEGEEIIEDPRSELVRQLLEYRRLKEQARALETAEDNWRQCRPRGLLGDVPEPSEEGNVEADRATAREALLDVDIYGIFAAYERILKSVLAQAPRALKNEGESLEQKIVRIEATLQERPFIPFMELILNPTDRGDVAATFLALLELVRRRAVRLQQQQEYGVFDIQRQNEAEADELARQEAQAAEASAEAAVQDKTARMAAQETIGPDGEKLPWLKKKRLPARPKFEGLLRPEDVEEIDTEEHEIGRRIDAILAAADAISERFEQSREGKIREDAPAEPEQQVGNRQEAGGRSDGMDAETRGSGEPQPAKPPPTTPVRKEEEKGSGGATEKPAPEPPPAEPRP
ncbi:MAG TPA: segregation/condensation protein A [Planctomycetota bacterium]